MEHDRVVDRLHGHPGLAGDLGDRGGRRYGAPDARRDHLGDCGRTRRLGSLLPRASPSRRRHRRSGSQAAGHARQPVVILIAGGTGRLGTLLVERLAGRGHSGSDHHPRPRMRPASSRRPGHGGERGRAPSRLHRTATVGASMAVLLAAVLLAAAPGPRAAMARAASAKCHVVVTGAPWSILTQCGSPFGEPLHARGRQPLLLSRASLGGEVHPPKEHEHRTGHERAPRPQVPLVIYLGERRQPCLYGGLRARAGLQATRLRMGAADTKVTSVVLRTGPAASAPRVHADDRTRGCRRAGDS